MLYQHVPSCTITSYNINSECTFICTMGREGGTGLILNLFCSQGDEFDEDDDDEEDDVNDEPLKKKMKENPGES